MSTDQLKAIVIEKILYEQNETMLQDVFNMLTAHDQEKVITSPEQRISIAAGLADYAAGRFVTQTELDRQESEWH